MANQSENINQRGFNLFLSDIEYKIKLQIDEIIHHHKFQNLERIWRSLYFLVKQTSFRDNIQIDILSVNKQSLQDDFEDAAEIVRSGLYAKVYSTEYGQFGGRPYAALIADFWFGPSHSDMILLKNMAAVATMAHAPLIAGAGPEFFSDQDFRGLQYFQNFEAHFQGRSLQHWQKFREQEDARSVGLALPRFLLRPPHVCKEKLKYQENISNSQQLLWGNSAFAFASRLAESFALYRWCPNIIGTTDGEVKGLTTSFFTATGELQKKSPLEIHLSENQEFELVKQGLIPLVAHKSEDKYCFFSAPSCQQEKQFGHTEQGRQASLNYKLGTQLPYLFIVNRLAHYLKVLQREQLGSFKSTSQLEDELNKWLRQYIADMDILSPGVRGRRPLRQAQIQVEENQAHPGWYKMQISVRPHLKYMGAFFTLSLVGKLDSEI